MSEDREMTPAPPTSPAPLPASAPLPQISDPSLVETQPALSDEATASSSSSSSRVPAETVISLKMSWSGKTFDLEVPDQDRVYDLKILIWSLTSVPMERIKLLGLTLGKTPPSENVVIKDLNLKSGKKFMMLGTSVKNSFKDPTRLQQEEIVDDFDVDYSSARVPPHQDPRNIRKIKEKFANLEIDIINEPRAGKRLLVLDLDYTIVDTRPLVDGSLPSQECARPGLHEFLKAMYPYYDIVVWSQTSWRWLEGKLTELGMLGEEDGRGYRISFVVDRRPMFTIFTERDGQPFKHEVKALQLLWNRWPENYGPHNTIHIDDLSRNFALNPGSGLKIKAYKGAATGSAASDQELPKLGRYLLRLAQGVEDFGTVDHGQAWQRWRKGKEF